MRRIHRAGKIASLIGIEGGHQIDNSLAVLRQMYDLGARYMTLTHVPTTGWADSATDAPRHHGLTPFGEDGGPGNEPPRHAGRPEPRLARYHARRAAREHGARDFLALLGTRARRPSARRAGRCAEARRGERRRGHGQFRDGLRIRCAQPLGGGPRGRGRSLRQPALRRPLYRPARSRQGGARGLGARASEAAGDARASCRSHRAHPASGRHRPCRTRIGFRRHSRYAARPRGRRQVSGPAGRAHAPRLERRRGRQGGRRRTCCGSWPAASTSPRRCARSRPRRRCSRRASRRQATTH